MTPLREQNRRASPADLQGRVGVGMGTMPTMDAGKDRLALAALCIDDTAGRTGLRSVRGGDVDQPAPCGFEFVIEHGGKLPPALVQDRSIEACLLTYATPWRLVRALGAGRHLGDTQILDGHKTEPARDVRAGDVVPVRAHTGAEGAQAGNATPLFGVAPRTPLAPCQHLLSLSDAPIDGQGVGHLHMLTVGQAERIGDASVDSDCGKRCGFDGFTDISHKRHAPLAVVPGDGDCLRVSYDGPREAELEPAQVVPQKHSAPFSVQNLERRLHGFETEAVVQAQPSRRWVAGGPLEERSEGPVEIVESRFLRCSGGLSDPVEIPSEVRQFPALAEHGNVAAFVLPILPPEVPALLKRQIVDQARYADPLTQGLSLGGRRMQGEAEAAKHGFTIAQEEGISA